MFQVPRDGERQVNIGEVGGDSDGNSNGDGDGNTDDDDGDDGRGSDAINTLSVSPKNKKLVCVTGTSRLYWSSTEGKSGMMDVSFMVDMGHYIFITKWIQMILYLPLFCMVFMINIFILVISKLSFISVNFINYYLMLPNIYFKD